MGGLDVEAAGDEVVAGFHAAGERDTEFSPEVPGREGIMLDFIPGRAGIIAEAVHAVAAFEVELRKALVTVETQFNEAFLDALEGDEVVRVGIENFGAQGLIIGDSVCKSR